jgi:fumarate hydratase class II
MARIEHDSLGDVEVPDDVLWQAQTQRAIANFTVSGEAMPIEVVHALAAIKRAAATVNAELGVIDAGLADAIVTASAAVESGEHDDQFPLDVFQTGSGTSTNMNVNEVVATLASRILGVAVHPNDHVNASQSSNDTFPSALHIAVVRALVRRLVPALQTLAVSLRGAQARFAEVVKTGRTHLMDAVPVTLGQEFGGYARQVELGVERVTGVLARAGELPLGGTAAGTGLNCPPGFAAAVISRLAIEADLPLTEAVDHFEAQGARDALVETSGVLRTIAVSMHKIAMDLRWMSSGPQAGLGEITLPALQPGRSIMPGKVNPVIPEVVHQVAAQVMGNDATIAFAGANGNFELNVMMPVMARNLLSSISLLTSAAELLAGRCIDGIVANAEHTAEIVARSPQLATALNPRIGYDAAGRVVKRSLAEHRTIRDIVLDEGLLTEAEADDVLDPLHLAEPDLPPSAPH